MSGHNLFHRSSPLICPVCRSPLQEVVKSGIVIDTCAQCHGVWLDRGELQKLADAIRSAGNEPIRERPSGDGYRDWHDDDDDDDRRSRHGNGHRPRSKLSRLMDFFD